MLHYLRKIGKSGMIDQIVFQKHLDLKKENPKFLQKIVRDSLKNELTYLQSLPTSLETNDFLVFMRELKRKRIGKMHHFLLL